MQDYQASSKEWANAYAGQAQADLTALVMLGGRPHSVCAMLLQMAMEKAAKAALLYGGVMGLEQSNTSHLCVSQLVHFLKSMIKHRRNLEVEKYKAVFPGVKALERLHPSVVKTVSQQKLEYPWESAPGLDPPRTYFPQEHLTVLPFAIPASPRERMPHEYLNMLHFAQWLVANYQNPLKSTSPP